MGQISPFYTTYINNNNKKILNVILNASENTLQSWVIHIEKLMKKITLI